MNSTRVLVIDDDPRLSGLVRVILESHGEYEVREENRSGAALAAALEFLPDKIILDVDMPGMDGGEVAQILRRNETLQHVPIVFLTSLVSLQEAGTGTLRRGGELFLPKPVDAASLIEAVEMMGRPALAAF